MLLVEYTDLCANVRSKSKTAESNASKDTWKSFEIHSQSICNLLHPSTVEIN